MPKVLATFAAEYATAEITDEKCIAVPWAARPIRLHTYPDGPGEA